MPNREDIAKFEKLIGEVKREGIDELMNWLKLKSDFYTAPASTRFHLACEGGLLRHSLNVCDCMFKKLENPVWKNILEDFGRESIIISSLLHDICKTNMYVKEYRSKKVYCPTGVRFDDGGNFNWETVVGYTVDDKVPYGHGEKSVMIIESYMKLTKQERYAIRWHMGFSVPSEEYNTLGTAMEKFPVILALHEADMEASKLLEKDEQ